MKSNQLSGTKQLNYFAIELLDLLGNRDPEQKQIDKMERLLFSAASKCQLSFTRPLSEYEIDILFLSLITDLTDEITQVLAIKKSIIDACLQKAAAIDTKGQPFIFVK